MGMDSVLLEKIAGGALGDIGSIAVGATLPQVVVKSIPAKSVRPMLKGFSIAFYSVDQLVEADPFVTAMRLLNVTWTADHEPIQSLQNACVGCEANADGLFFAYDF